MHRRGGGQLRDGSCPMPDGSQSFPLRRLAQANFTGRAAVQESEAAGQLNGRPLKTARPEGPLHASRSVTAGLMVPTGYPPIDLYR
jgi:hypothetical protein